MRLDAHHKWTATLDEQEKNAEGPVVTKPMSATTSPGDPKQHKRQA